jgi:hypothetical protein
MKYRKLRIAWSVGCGVVCLLLTALLVRSYRAEDRLSGHYATLRAFRFYSSRGCLVCYAPNVPIQPSSYPWQLAFGSAHWLQQSDARIATIPTLHYHPQEMWATLPYWFLLALCGLGTIAPWIRWRFSLRTLLIGMTVVAVALGLIFALSR